MSTERTIPIYGDFQDKRVEIDPVCGMEANPHSHDVVTYRGRSYRFCSADCQLAFKKDPAKYIRPEPKDASTDPHKSAPVTQGAAAGQIATDPVCGMKVDPRFPIPFEHSGRVYYFCSNRCLEKFKAEPARYA